MWNSNWQRGAIFGRIDHIGPASLKNGKTKRDSPGSNSPEENALLLKTDKRGSCRAELRFKRSLLFTSILRFRFVNFI